MDGKGEDAQYFALYFPPSLLIDIISPQRLLPAKDIINIPANKTSI
jgi:hypothetical protein